jgi:hypothetical protein
LVGHPLLGEAPFSAQLGHAAPEVAENGVGSEAHRGTVHRIAVR